MEEELYSSLEYFPLPLLIMDENLNILKVNEDVSRFIGLNKNEIVGIDALSLIDPKDSFRFKEVVNKVFNTSNQIALEIIIKKFNGGSVNCLLMLKSFYDNDSNNKYCSIAIFDFTNQKMNEEVLKQSLQRFKNLANTSPVMIWISDLNGLFSFVNNIWLEFTDSKPGQQLGMNWLRNVHPEDFEKTIRDYQKAVSAKVEFSLEFRFLSGNKNYEWVLLKGKPRYSAENIFTGFIGSCFSINEQKKVEEKVSNLNKELVEINATKDKFFSIISHDLRSPLSGLMGILEILDESYKSLDENEKLEIISEASKSAKTTFNLIENLLEWARIQTGKIKYQPEMLALKSIIEDTLPIFDQSIKNKNLTIIDDVKTGTKIYSDKSITETILRNLISNAVKFTNKSGSITISSEQKDESIIIKIKDSGVGMDEKKLSDIFLIDVNTSTKGTAMETGTGLGLIISKEFVEKQGGEIWVESRKNEGTTFYFTVKQSK